MRKVSQILFFFGSWLFHILMSWWWWWLDWLCKEWTINQFVCVVCDIFVWWTFGKITINQMWLQTKRQPKNKTEENQLFRFKDCQHIWVLCKRWKHDLDSNTAFNKYYSKWEYTKCERSKYQFLGRKSFLL